ncbi:uncharacterized protein [Equus caballus]|uniref:uncharacterized protein isoform X3 n=1 Tax=Equus caballus TaxID=9796 RepID=UPI000C9EB0D6|nr:uncharacterized protein LOC111771063 [Equus caballus]
MMFDRCCQRERLYKTLYIVHIFILAGAVYYYFHGSVGKTAPDHEIVGESSQPIGKTLRPVWGLMDKCYPVTTQRRRVKSGKKQASEAMTPKAMGGLNDAAPKEETDILSQDEGEGSKKIRKEMAVHPAEASEVESKEERPVGRVPQLLRKLWLGWFPASDVPETLNHE